MSTVAEKREMQVINQLDRLEETLAETSQAVQILFGRCEGVLSPVPPQGAGDKSAPSDVLCALAERIRQSRNTSRETLATIRQILERLEV